MARVTIHAGGYTLDVPVESDSAAVKFVEKWQKMLSDREPALWLPATRPENDAQRMLFIPASALVEVEFDVSADVVRDRIKNAPGVESDE